MPDTAVRREPVVSTARVPMLRPFSHAAHARAHAESVLIQCNIGGAVGWGEGAPRPYVTGETSQSASEALAGAGSRLLLDHLTDLWKSGASFEDGPRFLMALDIPRLLGGLHRAPAAAAALETALLDAWCRLFGHPLRDVVAAVSPLLVNSTALIAPLPTPRPVALVVDLANTERDAISSLTPAAAANLRHVKLKASASPSDTAERARELRTRLAALSAGAVTLSVDANGAWDGPQSLLAAELLGGVVDWLEEPTVPRSWGDLRTIRERTGMAIMLDESAIDSGDVETAANLAAADSINIRVSKCGGLLPALRVAMAARSCGLGLQVGVQVAEIGPLWVVGRILATHLSGLLAVEAGRQDEWFDPPLTYPPYRIDRTRHLAPEFDGIGLGVIPSPALRTHCPTLV
ncbi:enolase C-terminal domain-like protein [Gordonia sp. CPCC 205333]|uniref:enolase C-terminal domain-like protein n=1 Tax=Gordonia sp. CPCC 205333 TaxID=3140790 RepID=UPI003AF3FAAB